MNDYREILDAGLNALSHREVALGEVRVVDMQEEAIEVKRQEVESLSRSENRGFGIRALVDGAWGYSGSNILTVDEVARCAREATELAKKNVGRVHPAELAALEPQQGRYETPIETAYFDVSIDDKLELLFGATAVLGDDSRIIAPKAAVSGLRRKTWFASTAGTDISQQIDVSGGRISALAVDDDDVQIRSYPKAADGNINAGGWEFVVGLDLVGESERVRDEAIALLTAPECPAGKQTLIIDGAQMSLQIHESCGHPAELDRALGEEISLAGCSFMRPETLGQLRYGSDVVNIYADSTSAGGPGTFGWDDEGVPAGRWDIVKEGTLVGYLGSRETAERVPGVVPGAMRASGWDRVPIVRMVNVNLEPGDQSLDEMIADTRDGLLVSVNKSWSIDDFRLNFQFSCEAGWKIVNGKITTMVKNPIYAGKTPEFWGSCDAIADSSHWNMWGWRYCGKGDPMQLMHVGHGCSPARFQNIDVGSSNAG